MNGCYTVLENKVGAPTPGAPKRTPINLDELLSRFKEGGYQAASSVRCITPAGAADRKWAKTVPVWYFGAVGKVISFSEAQAVWDAYDTTAPTAHAKRLAVRIIDAMANIDRRPDKIAILNEGGIGLYLLREQGFAGIECYNEGGMAAVLNGIEVETWPVKGDDLSIQTAVNRITG